MTTFAGNARESDKLGTGTRFSIEIDGTIEGTFSECSGLTATIATTKWEEGGQNFTTLKFPAYTDFSNITLKQGITNSTKLFDWFMDVLNVMNMGSAKQAPLRKNITITLRTEKLEPIRGWQFKRAFPVKWTGPTMQSTSNTASVEAIEFAHEGFIGL
jgi:phage tail-like protein